MAKIKKIQESGTTIYPATITNAVKDPETGKTIPEILKEREEDTYPKMTVGFAENIVGDGSATAEEFSFRPTAGVNRNTLNDGAARIHSIKGRSVVANQLIYPAQVYPFIDDSGLTFSHGEGVLSIKGILSEKCNITLPNAKSFPQNTIIGHKYLFGVETEMPQGFRVYLSGCTPVSSVFDSTQTKTIKECIAEKDYGMYILGISTEQVIGTEYDYTSRAVIIDLTQEFGAGNEPETVEEYYQRKPIVINEEEYNKGKLVNLVPKAIKTTGLNQFNGTYAKVLGGVQYYLGGNYTSVGFATEEGGAIEAITAPTSSEVIGGSVPVDRLYTPTQNGYIYANGDSICISLYWPTEYGKLYGTYKPYKPFERDLSWVSKYFPNGMRSAGNVADEIRFNSTTQKWEAVKRVGVVDLGTMAWRRSNDKTTLFTANMETVIQSVSSGNCTCPKYVGAGYQSVYWAQNDKVICIQNGYVSSGVTSVMIKDSNYLGDNDFNTNDFKAAMSGVLLNYELRTPIVTEITENVNFDYDVSDYGTEELIVAEGEQSAPLCADIEYSPNVLAVLKNAPDIANDVDMLKSQLSALTAQLAALTATNNNE